MSDVPEVSAEKRTDDWVYLCTPFLDTHVPEEIQKANDELHARGYSRAKIFWLRRLAGFGLCWNAIWWKWQHLDFSDVLRGWRWTTIGIALNLALFFPSVWVLAVLTLVVGASHVIFIRWDRRYRNLKTSNLTNKESQKYPCPCCGYLTFAEQPPGTYDICEVCYWEDDATQFDDPSYEGGANKVSLEQARENFRKFRVSENRFGRLVRDPRDNEKPK